ncbi:MAG TPA: aspartyl/asparaginyl beta-hydroxylase domain-containing protein [Rudaea sp.]
MNASIATDSQLLEARQFALSGDVLKAESAYRRILDAAPEHPEALNFFALRALGLGAHEQAVQLLERAVAGGPADAQLLNNLGNAYRSCGRFDEARGAFARALETAPDFFIARLHLAHMLERLGQSHAALVNYFGAITQAQAKGRWLSEQTTAPMLRDLVRHAMAFVNAGRRALFEGVLAPFRAQFGDEALRRTLHALHVYLGDEPKILADPRQKPLFLYFPGLPTSAYIDSALFEWTAQLERNTAVIRDELLAVLRDDRGLEPFLRFDSDDQIPKYLGGTNAKPAWDAFFFYRHGVRYDDNCARCPKTTAILESLPLVRIGEHAPEICFSMLTPGTHILPHHGVTNIRLVTHLPLIVPANCALNVGGEVHEWKEGRCVTFDDTFEHEAWNRSDALRAVLILDGWNPHLTQVEREALSALIPAIGDFNKECGIKSPN